LAVDLTTVGVKLEARGMAQVKGAFADISGEAKKIKSNLISLLSPTNAIKTAMAGIAGGLTGAAIGSFLKGAINEARDAELVLHELQTAVENTGQSYSVWEKNLDGAADGLAKLTTFSDDAARGALTRMVVVSGDVAGSIKNVTVAADLAAFKHIELSEAADVVGRAMVGNTKALKQLGISVKDGAGAIDELADKVRGFAEGEADTLTGALKQMSNQWGEVQEAIGKAIVGGDDMKEVVQRITDKLQTLTIWVDNNRDAWRRWTVGLLDESGGPLSFLNKIIEKQQEIARTAPHPFGNLGLSQQIRDRENQGFFDGGTHAPAVVTADLGGRLPAVIVHAKAETDATKKSTRALDERIETLTKVIQFEDTRAKVTQELTDLEARFTKQVADGTLAYSERAKAVERLAKVQDALAQKFITTTKPTGPQISVTSPGSTAGLGIPATLPTIPESAISENRQKMEARIDETTVAVGEKIMEASNTMSAIISQGFSQTLGDAIYNGIAAAFDGKGIGGVIKAFGKTMLAGVGQMMTQLGMVYLEYGVIMQSLSALLPNPFTAGPAGIAIGAALVAMGSALGSVAKGGGGRGTAKAGAFREPNAGQEMTRLKFINRDGSTVEPVKRTTNNFTVIGTDDPKAQRAIMEMIRKGERRAA
jgi:hypothetical protein